MARGSSSSSSEEKAAEVSLPTSKAKDLEKKDETNKTMNDDILSSSQGRVDQALVERAVQALLKYHDDKQQASSEKKNQLLGNDSVLQVQFRLLVGPTRPSPKPIAIALPYAICKMVRGGEKEDNDSDDDDDDGLDEAEVCFIVKDDSKPMVQEMIRQFPQYMANVKKVLGLESLRKKHSSPTQRRALCAKYTLFLCDDRILPMMTKCLGKEFVQNKKMPIPVDMRRTTAVPLAIYKALRSTFLHLRDAATCITIVAGTTGMRPTKLVDNCMAICKQAVLKMPRSWANVQSIALTTTECNHGLPVYNKIPAELEEISRMAGLPAIWKSSLQKKNDGDNSDNDEKKKVKKQQEGKRKRKELAAKSPLVRALKQQKKQKNTKTKEVKGESSDNVEKVDEKAKVETTNLEPTESSSNRTSEKKTMTRSHDEKNDTKEATPKSKTTEHTEKTSSISTKSSKKKDKETAAKGTTEKQSKAAASNKTTIVETPHKKTPEAAEDGSKSSKKSLKEKREETSSSSSKKRKNSVDKGNDNDKDEASPEKKSRTSTGNVEKSTETTSLNNKPFHAAAKFSGSKKGYVFRNGANGLGYYVDVKPVVDKLAIAALVRMGNASQQQQQRGGGGGGRRSSSSTPGKNKRHSGGGGRGGGGGSGGRRR